MAKQPEIETILVGYNERHKLNKNFKAIAEKFDNGLSRSPDTPNFMETNLDVADANVTNVNRLEVDRILVNGTDFTGFSDQYIYKITRLGCGNGAILTHDADGEPTCLPPGDNGEVLKTIGTIVGWAEDIDTDTDTVGITVQEDGVTVAENVVNINFAWTGDTLATNPVAGQVDLGLSELLGPIFEDTDQLDSNLNPDLNGTGFFALSDQTSRLDLTTTSIGIPSADNQYYAVVEASYEITSSGADMFGTYGVGVQFYDNTGTATPLTGNVVSQPVGEVRISQNSGDSTATAWVFCGIPAGTKYVDFYWATQVGIPAGITVANLDNRYRAIIPAAARDTFTTPLSNGWQNGYVSYP